MDQLFRAPVNSSSPMAALQMQESTKPWLSGMLPAAVATDSDIREGDAFPQADSLFTQLLSMPVCFIEEAGGSSVNTLLKKRAFQADSVVTQFSTETQNYSSLCPLLVFDRCCASPSQTEAHFPLLALHKKRVHPTDPVPYLAVPKILLGAALSFSCSAIFYFYIFVSSLIFEQSWYSSPLVNPIQSR